MLLLVLILFILLVCIAVYFMYYRKKTVVVASGCATSKTAVAVESEEPSVAVLQISETGQLQVTDPRYGD